MWRSRAIWLRDQVDRKHAANRSTIQFDPRCHPAMALGQRGAPIDAKQCFIDNYRAIRELCTAVPTSGLVAIAMDGRGVAGAAVLAAKSDVISLALIGRHAEADLYLDGDPTLSLRHLMIILYPVQPGGDLRFRVMDLRTGIAFSDEHDRRLEALEAEGPVFVRCGRTWFFLLPTSTLLPMPEDALDAWACVPDRVYCREVAAEPDRWQRQAMRAPPSHHNVTSVRTIPGPAFAQRGMLADGEQPRGELGILDEDRSERIIVGSRALQQGVLLGRYPRCDNQGLSVLSSPQISRVHLLLLEIGDTIHAIDVASTNGVWLRGDAVRVTELSYGDALYLGSSGAWVSWGAIH